MTDNDQLRIPLTTAEAEKLTTRIGLRLETVADNAEAALELIEQALTGQVHAALGYDSWAAYFTDRFGGTLGRLRKAERQPVVEQLAGTGLSNRAIAEITSVDEGTVRNDLRGAENSAPAKKVTGRDGKTYPSNVTPIKATFLPNGKPDAASTEDMGKSVPAARQRPRRRSLPDQLRIAVDDLRKLHDRFQRITEDDRFRPDGAAYAMQLGQARILLDHLGRLLGEDEDEGHADA